MATKYTIVILGASYGSLLASKLLLAGHHVRLACLAAEAAVINAEGTRVFLPVAGREDPVEIDSRRTSGSLAAAEPHALDLSGVDLVALAMQEPQYAAPQVRALLTRIAQMGLPCLSIMNMPPLPYLARIPGIGTQHVRTCYTQPGVWDRFEPRLMTLASPDPQAFRPDAEQPNLLQVSLPTNFKVARFESDAHTAMLRDLQRDIETIRFDTGTGTVELPVKLKVHDSVFVPLAKWSMLLTGNYRCIGTDGMRSIRDAVHADLARSRAMYEWVCGVCQSLGAASSDLVPFTKYARAAEGLSRPASVARALLAGASNVERVDCLVRVLAAQHGTHNDELEEIVTLVDQWLDRNRRK